MILSQKKKSFSLSIGLQSWNKTNAENLNRKKSMKEMLMKQKNVKDYEILNTNIKRKLTLL